jgi:hypothetical protein
MTEQQGDSHTTEAEQEAAATYTAAMETESQRFNLQLGTLNEEHEARVKEITDAYTDALQAAGGGIPF